MGRLGDSFHLVSAEYDRGRPRYPEEAGGGGVGGAPGPSRGAGLGDSFHLVSAEYDRGRPRYPEEAVRVMLEGLPDPADVVDIGAGTGQLSLALGAAGARVTAVEPGPEQRTLLETRLAGRASVLDARAEQLPLDDSSVDLVVCADSFHWLDADRALAEFRRVLRPGARLCLSSLMPRWDPAPWAEETGAILAPLWKRAEHPLLAG